MGKFIDLTGQKFGRLTVIKRADHNDNQNKPLWVCECDCGDQSITRTSSLRSGDATSCGCRRIESCTSHGKSSHPLYTIWNTMRQRCYRGNSRQRKYYQDKGICVCKEWHDFENFCQWAINNGWQQGLEIDRIDNDGNYEPSNCRFVTRSDNMSNRSAWGKVPVKGVYIFRDKFRASICIDGHKKHIGLFTTVEEAADAIEKYKKGE